MSQTSRIVLIVDDSPEDRELYRRYLQCDRQYSYTLLEATLGREALELWHKHQPDAVLVDYRLPDLDGLEFLARLQSFTQQPCLPVIMVTGHGNQAIAVQAMKAGAQDYLVKQQVTPERLQLAVNGAIETVQLRTQLQQRIERERLVLHITQKIHQTLDLSEILQTTVTEVRQFLQTDRVLAFELKPDGSGTVVAESVGAEWRSLLFSTIHDPCLAKNYLGCNRQELLNYDPAFAENYLKRYRQGYVTAIFDIQDSSIDPCHVELLAQFQVKANLVVPIVQDNQLWGLLIAHHCASPRFWQPLEIDLLKELAIQVTIALRQAELYQQAQHELQERKRSAEALRDSEERYRCLAELIPQLVWTANTAGELLDVNQRWLEFTGLTLDQVGITGWEEVVHPEDVPILAQKWNQAVQQGTSYEAEGRMRRADGSYRWHLHQAIPQKNKQGQIVKWFGTATDIETQKELEVERDRLLQLERTARETAERANRIKDEFLAILSHELRSPLNPILGWAKLLQTRKFNETKTAEALATIERNAKLQTQLIDDLLDVAKILRGKLSMETAPVNLAFVIECAIDTVRTAAVSKSILLHPLLPNIGQVSGDSNRLQQIVWNLLSNAIKFTPKQGRVEIRLERVDDEAHIIVSDTGIGINPDFLPHIFESFRQEDVSITRKYGGLGLGLAIVRQLVEAHGGTITADSPGEGLGATFTVCLPLLNIEPQSKQTDELSQQALDLTGIRVLAVDDDPDARELLTVLFAQYGAEVLTVASAASVLANLESFQPDVLVSDIGMPEVDGYSLIQQIRTLTPEKGGQIPAIALTAYARVDDQQRAITSGYQRHVTKPLEPEQLARSVMALVHKTSGRKDVET